MDTIESIEVIPIRVPLERLYRGSFYRMRNRCTLITRIRTSDGIVGEAYNGDTDDEQALIMAIIRDEMVPSLIGRDACNIEGAWEAMLPPSYDQLRDRRLAMQAMACIDSALWDAFGKRTGQPLYRLWGGYRDAVPAIGIGGYYGHSDDEMRDEVRFFMEQGFCGMKFKVGGVTPEEDARRLRVARDFAGPNFVLICDANQGYTTAQAVAFCRLVEDVGLRWFEEPCRWYNDRLGLRDVRLISGIPVCAGQSELTRVGARDLIVDGAVNVCNYDSSWGGGPTEWRRVASIAMAYDVQMAHHEESQISLHLLAAIPHGTYAECFTPRRDPIYWNLLANRAQPRDGLMHVPDRPGFGWELDADYIAKYRVEAP